MVIQLPDHIIETIFSKLPISNFPICRLVCRAWNDLVLNSKTLISNGFLVFTSTFYSNYIPMDRNSKIHYVESDILSPVASFEYKKHISFHSSCNGLLFVTKTNRTMRVGILNPMTNEFFEVPEFKPEIEMLDQTVYNLGFGFSPKTKKYKLFRVGYKTRHSRGRMEVFRFGTRNHQWSLIHNDLPFLTIREKSAYLNGAVYWIARERKRIDECVIYVIDVETEKFESKAVLKIGCFPLSMKIESLNDTIYVIVYIYEPYDAVQVWRMQGKDLWVRDFVVDGNERGCCTPRSFYMLRVKAFEDGGILVLMRGVYYCLDKMGRKMKIKPFDLNTRLLEDICPITSLNFGSLPNILGEHK